MLHRRTHGLEWLDDDPGSGGGYLIMGGRGGCGCGGGWRSVCELKWAWKEEECRVCEIRCKGEEGRSSRRTWWLKIGGDWNILQPQEGEGISEEME